MTPVHQGFRAGRRVVVHTCPFVPAEWIAAHGLHPLRIVPATGSGAHDAAPNGVCAYAWAFVRQATVREDAAGIVVTTSCDQMRRSCEVLEKSSRIPVFLMHVPHVTTSGAAVGLYVDELTELGHFLEAVGGARPADTALAEEMRRWEIGRQKLRMARNRCSARRFAEAIADFGQGDGCFKDAEWPDGNETAAGREIPGLPGRRSADRIRLAITGAPVAPDHFDLFDVVERIGGEVVLNATPSGEFGIPGDPGVIGSDCDPLVRLAQVYLDSVSDAFFRPNRRFHERLRNDVADRGVQGLVVRKYVWCDIWHAEVGHLRETLGLPVLALDIPDTGSLDAHGASRIEAFLEMLRSARKAAP